MGWETDRIRFFGLRAGADAPTMLLGDLSADSTDRADDSGLGDPCVIRGCVETIAVGDLVYCPEHRRRADDGTLWLRCVNHPTRPVAPHDPIACAECRRRIDATVMPWETRN